MRNGMTRREFGRTVSGGLVGAAVAAGMPLSRAHGARKPNVVYLFSDEHRWQSMSFTEMPEVHTPHMAKMASQGVQFTHCISNYPVCSPHRAMLLTGRWPYQQGMIDNGLELSPNEMTVAKAFKGAGYATGYVGKWHLGGTRAEPFGFDESLIWTNESQHMAGGKYHPRDGKPVETKGYNATLMTDQALAFVEKHREEPFFLMVSWHPPHARFDDAPADKVALYPEGSLPWRPNVPEEVRTGRKENPDVVHQTEWRYYQGYHAHISAIDEELGRVMAKLEELGLADDTIVVYSADHGSMFGSHSLASKRQPYEESIRVPFLVRWPGHVSGGKASPALFGTVDVMPTLCALAGVPVPASCAGRDMSAWLRGEPGPEPEAQLIMHISKENASKGQNHPAPLFRGLRTRRHTYAVYPDRPWCLFDNEADPYQTANLIDKEETAALRKELHALLGEYLKRAEDPLVLPGV